MIDGYTARDWCKDESLRLVVIDTDGDERTHGWRLERDGGRMEAAWPPIPEEATVRIEDASV